MKNETIAAIAAVLVIILGIQAYTMFRLNDRLNQLSGFYSQTGEPQTLSNLPKSNRPKSDDDEFFKDRTWNPYAEIQHMQNEMEQMFDDSFSRFHMKTPLGSLSKTPDVDLKEKSDRYIVTVNAPGADESSIDVKLEDQVLRISIKTEHAQDETDEKNGQYQYRERFVGQFQRALTLPGPANAAKMTTEYHNGVLTITIPKA
ncbi:Hsp20/alpha crystallin family protein [Methylobacter sp.]|uniref:Hsp20/alpha crystallin family protein n=1 Tax=Methylobacter sp. TaxID=2051955 RepID=UPI002487C5DD|nr:Hsp20/alpha crystallin family protein [Methylobacter sp.]MDI1277955.1 Hsp20/alpha crystallin family protein [Methylobacter sp.]MDI1358754.1 Hsp20/alpha crystallin family protein [Methylobacter sp.]